VIIDCRYGYEYDGGHIQGAISMTHPNDFIELFFSPPRQDCVIIFHCEFSRNRGPKMAMQFRDYDRHVNRIDYPALFYPQVFILDGGYREFHERYSDLCDGDYVPMLDEGHRQNGDLSRCTSAYHHATSDFDDLLRPPSSKGMHSHLLSPRHNPFDQSPITKTMCCYSSPRGYSGILDDSPKAQRRRFTTENF
jgi:M-phase inducer tyrosine phosphatase